MEKTDSDSDNNFFRILRQGKLLLADIIYSLRKSSANLSDDPRRELIRELKTSMIAPLIAVCSYELQGALSLLPHREQSTSKTGINFVKCRV